MANTITVTFTESITRTLEVDPALLADLDPADEDYESSVFERVDGLGQDETTYEVHERDVTVESL